MKHGHGTEKFGNGDFYVGNYVNGKPDGYGEYYWSNGCQYKGFFKNGLRHGKGIWKKASGPSDKYDGEWVNDKKFGYGVYNWASGNYYEGNYFDDLRHGYGEMFWIDGSIYKGNWEKGIQNGEGELHMSGNRPKIGLFQNNVYITDHSDRDEDETFYNKIETPKHKTDHQKSKSGTPKNETLPNDDEEEINLKTRQSPLFGPTPDDMVTFRQKKQILALDGLSTVKKINLDASVQVNFSSDISSIIQSVNPNIHPGQSEHLNSNIKSGLNSNIQSGRINSSIQSGLINSSTKSGHNSNIQSGQINIQSGLLSPNIQSDYKRPLNYGSIPAKSHDPNISLNSISNESFNEHNISNNTIRHPRSSISNRNDNDIRFRNNRSSNIRPPRSALKAENRNEIVSSSKSSKHPIQSADARSRSPMSGLTGTLTHKEFIKWNHMKNKLNLNSDKFRNLDDPEVCAKIRLIVNPPIWKPWRKKGST